jgi:tRNA(fMet)-specific endonuclease VapC
MIVADTDVLIDFLRGRGFADRVALELGTGSFGTTAITAFELRSGAHSPKQRNGVEALLTAMTILPFTEEDAVVAANIRQELEGSGQGIGMADYMIAAICRSSDSVLLTLNRKHFERVSGLRVSRAR